MTLTARIEGSNVVIRETKGSFVMRAWQLCTETTRDYAMRPTLDHITAEMWRMLDQPRRKIGGWH